MSAARLPALSPVAWARLWLSYQRYGLLLCVAPAVAAGAAAWWGPWWLAVLVAVAGAAPFAFGVQVLARWPRKLRATRVALHRIGQGRFRPESVRSYCGDPCFRVVAHELLVRAGVPAGERRALVARYADETRRAGDLLVLVDRAAGALVTIHGDGRIERRSLGAGPPAAPT